jgi:hypothetical protein
MAFDQYIHITNSEVFPVTKFVTTSAMRILTKGENVGFPAAETILTTGTRTMM